VSELLELYNRVHKPYSQFEIQPKNAERAKYIEGQIEKVYKKNLSRHYEATKRLNDLTIDVRNTDIYEILLNSLDTYISTHIPNKFNFRLFASMYLFPYVRQLMPSLKCRTIVLRDVFYKNKVWYDKERTPLKIAEFDADFEYKLFPKKHEDIKDDDVEDIETPIMFLDYIYDFYNFGEFWDVVKRLQYADPSTKGLPLFHVPKHRVSEIDYYFSKLEYGYPSAHIYNRHKLYHFHEIHISIVEGATRGVFDRYIAYSLNCCINPEIAYTLPFSYKLYLTRGSNSRNIMNEDSLISELQDTYNFVVLNGSEPLNIIMYYFTHASLILGAHSSLMKNMIWCAINPIFIEITPFSRSLNPCFSANATSLGFQTMYFICECDEKEQIRLSDTQRSSLLELIGKLASSLT